MEAQLYSAEACYINTGHPDFLTGHKAMAVVHERLTASKAPILPTPGGDNKAQRAPSVTQLPNSSATVNKDLLEPQGDGIGFFGSFFQKKKRPGVLENVC